MMGCRPGFSWHAEREWQLPRLRPEHYLKMKSRLSPLAAPSEHSIDAIQNGDGP